MSLAVWLVAIAVFVGLGLLAVGLREPLTARLGWRNAWRHRRQTITVILGLLAGTAVIGASLVTGDSLEAGLERSAIRSVDELDVLISIPGNLYMPAALADRLVAEPLPERVEGASRLVLESAAVEHPRESLYEPGAAVLGFDPEEDRPFGPFKDQETGEHVFGQDLGPDQAYVNKRLADKLAVSAGDTIHLTYRASIVPVMPDITWLNGTLVAASAAPAPDGGYVYAHSAADVYETTLDVPLEAEGIVAVVTWPDPTNSTDLDIELEAPDGTRFVTDNGSLVPVDQPELPGPLPVGVPPGTLEASDNPAVLVLQRTDMQPGMWTMRVHAKDATNQPYLSFGAILLPEYDLNRARAFYEGLEETFGPAAEAIQPDLSGRGKANTRELQVVRVVAQEGKGVFFGADAVFVQRATAQDMYGVGDKVNWIKVTNHGDALGGLPGTPDVVDFFEARRAHLAGDPVDADAPVGAAIGEAGSSVAASNVQVRPLKQDFITSTEEAAAGFTSFLTLVGSFTLIAGAMLIVNIFSMLAEERRHELGIARAVGLTRRKLILAFTFEGSLYTLAASALGVLVGMALAGVLVWGIGALAPADVDFVVPYTATPSALAVAFAAGALITFVTVTAASYRASRLNIVAAIRDLDDPGGRHAGRRWPFIVLAGALAGATIVGLIVGSYLAYALGPAFVLLAVGPLLRRSVGPRLGWISIGLLVIGYIAMTFVFGAAPDNLERDIAVVLRGVLLVIAGTIVLVHLDAAPRAVAWLLSRVPKLAPIAHVATTYPLHRRFRTGLTLSMFALVIMVIVVVSVFFTIFTPDITRESGDYHVVGDAQVPVLDLANVSGAAALQGTDEDPFRDVERFDALLEHSAFGRERVLIDGETSRGFQTRGARFVGFDTEFATHNGFRLAERDERFGSTDQEVWQQVAADPSLVIVSYTHVGNLSEPDGLAHHVGSVLTINTSASPRDYVIAGIMEQTYFSGVWMAQEEVEELFVDLEGLYLFRLDPDADSAAAAKRIERAFRPIGMDADDLEAEAAQLQQDAERIFRLFQAYLALGLIVGVASIGIVTSRAVLERRREIGMLKAIGFSRGMIAGAFLAEVIFVLFAASIIGTSMGLLVAWATYQGQLAVLPGAAFVVPWGQILELLAVALAASVLATLLPVKRASDVPAAEALRTIE